MRPDLADVETLTRQAGVIVRAGYNRVKQVDHKGAIDLVTETDHRSEAFLIESIRKQFAGHAIIAEESGQHGSDQGQVWYLDPLDGTVNYAHGVPFFSVSVAYAEGGQLKLGAVYDPIRDECFTAERGRGAWLNGRSVSTSQAASLDECLLVTGFPYDVWKNPANNLEEHARFTVLTQGVRRLGSAALDLCYVACGRLDGYWELRLNPWDLAAGGLIAQEAGALVTAIDGVSDFLSPPWSVLSAPPRIHPLMRAVLQQNGPEPPG